MVKFEPIASANYRYDYLDIFRSIARGRIPKIPTYRQLCQDDLFFLLYFGLEREDINHRFLVDCIREAEADHADTLDLWAREHYKSTIFTYGIPIQDLINNPEERIGIFSHTRPIAKGFLRQIKHTLESDVPVRRWFPEIFWKNPKSQAPKWSEDDGLIVKRKGHPKESSIEAWGLVDGQPTSKHFTIRIYDDVVTEDGVGTPAMIQKTLRAYELSQSLGTGKGQKRVVGTHYHFADLYAHLKNSAERFEIHGRPDPERVKVTRGYKVRVKPATRDGSSMGEPVFLSQERLDELRREQRGYVFSCQQLLSPIEDESRKFRLEWIRRYKQLPDHLNKYIICDPANEKQKGSDFTVVACIGIDAARNRFLLDLVRAQLNLGERWKALRDIYIRNMPIEMVGYEKYGKDADISYHQEKQEEQGIYFHIEPLGGRVNQYDRIMRLIPLFESGRFLLPYELIYEGQDMVKVFLDEEYSWFPYCAHQDIFDCLSRIEDEAMMVTAPVSKKSAESETPEDYVDPSDHQWMAA